MLHSKRNAAKVYRLVLPIHNKIKPLHILFAVLSLDLCIGGRRHWITEKINMMPPYRAYTRRMTVSYRCGASRINFRNSDRRNFTLLAFKCLRSYSCVYCSADIAFILKWLGLALLESREKETFEHWTVTGFDGFSCASDFPYSIRCTD